LAGHYKNYRREIKQLYGFFVEKRVFFSVPITRIHDKYEQYITNLHKINTMKQLTKMLTLAMALFLGLNNLQGVPAYPGLIQQIQSDGTVLDYYLFGDEDFSWAQTTDEYTILRNEKGDYVYMIRDSKGDLVLSTVIAHNPGQRNAGEELFVSTLETKMWFSKNQMDLVNQAIAVYKSERSIQSFPTTGDRKLICILMQYPDRMMVKTQADFNALFNTVGYNLGGAVGSVKDYYLESSYNQFNLTVDVVGPYTAQNNMAYYTNNGRILCREGVLAANPVVNFADYDNDNDGYVDGVYMIFAGYGREAGGPATAIWSHASSMSPAVSVDGVYAQRYSCSPELRGNSGSNLTHIGVICHEFGHVLGAMDYYDTNAETGGNFEGTGNWDMMAGGSWNSNGAVPAHHNGFTKTKIYNWAPVIILTQPTSITLENALQNSTSFYQFNTTTNNEYFLVENRQQIGFDAAIPGQGMIIYHVHPQVNSSGNQINVSHPQKMYPVCASATSDPTSTPSSYGNINSAGCAWPYSTKTNFTDATLPSSKSWAGANTNRPVTNITRNSTLRTISFDFMGGEGNPTVFDATAIGGTEIQLAWNHTTVNYMIVAYSPTGIFGTPASGVTYTVGSAIPNGGTVIYVGTDTSFIHSGLIQSSAHYYKVWARKNTVPQYSSGIATYQYTACEKVNRFPFVENFGTKLMPTCFTVVDSQGSNQVWRFNNPQNRPFQSTTSSNGFAILDSENFGSGNTQNSQMITGLFDFSEYQTVNVSFQHFYSHRNSSARFFYSIDGGATYLQLAAYTATVGSLAAPATATFNVSAQVAGQSNVRFKWSYTATFGIFWCIDDFTVTAQNRHAMAIKHQGNIYSNGNKVIDYDAVTVGNSKTYSFYVHSIGDLPLTISNPTVNSAKYTITTNPSGTISAGDSSLFVVTYQPTVAMTDTVVISIANNTPTNNPYTVVLKSNVATQFNATFTINDGLDPVAGATVALTGFGSQTTNASGQATFTNVTAGVNIAFTASKTGHVTTTGTIKLVDANATFAVTVPRTDVQITFHLKNNLGNNVTNSSVTVVGYGQQFTSAGQTTFTLPPLTDIDFTCAAPNYINYVSTINTGTSSRVVEIIMERITYSVTVNVKSAGNPVSGADVTLGAYGNQTTDADGVTIFTGVLPSNSITIWAGAEGYIAYQGTIQVTGNRVVDINLTVGIDDAPFGDITLYPVPTNNILNVNNLDVPVHYNLVDVSGRILIEGNLEVGSNALNLDKFGAGMYYLILKSADAQKTYSIIKQ
jgi:M6 family metalloprotease-like protein